MLNRSLFCFTVIVMFFTAFLSSLPPSPQSHFRPFLVFSLIDFRWMCWATVLGAQRGTEQNQVSFEEQVFASQAILYKCRRRRAAITSEDVSCLLRLALAFIGPGLRPVLTQVGVVLQ